MPRVVTWVFVWRTGAQLGVRGGVGSGRCAPVEPLEEFAVDSAGRFEFFGALRECLLGLEET